MNPDHDRLEKLLARIRAMHAACSPHAEALRAQGLEVDGFLADCEEFFAAAEGRGDGEFDMPAFVARVKAFSEEVSEYDHIQAQAQAVQLPAELLKMADIIEEEVPKLREHGGKMEADSAAQLEASVARIREELAAGKLPKEALADMMLTLNSQQAELARRIHYRHAACALYWEKWPPERWAKLSPEERAKLEDLLASWREAKEEVLGSLPLEDRRRLEAMSYEDFDNPDTPKV